MASASTLDESGRGCHLRVARVGERRSEVGEVIDVKVGSDWGRGRVGRWVIGPQGAVEVPDGWVHVPPGDPLVTRRIKARGPAWVVSENVRNKTFSRGLFAPSVLVERVRAAAEAERGSGEYQKKLEAGRARREREQADYVRQFHREVVAFLGFAAVHREVAEQLAARVTAHATPVGSGTVARTKRIDVDQRAEAAVIAWMRHQTTAYDSMSIARVAGRRREVRRELAARSRALLERYRSGKPAAEDCPLARALLEVEAVVERAVPRVGGAKVVGALSPLPPVAFGGGDWEDEEDGENEDEDEEDEWEEGEGEGEDGEGEGEDEDEDGEDGEGEGEVATEPEAKAVPLPPLQVASRRVGSAQEGKLSEVAKDSEADERRARMEAVRARMAQRAKVVKRPPSRT